MTSNIAEFENRFRELIRRIPEDKVVPAQRDIALRVMRSLILKTPVRTGRLRMEWQLTIGAPAVGPIGGVDALSVRAPIPYAASEPPGTGAESASSSFNRALRGLEQLKPFQVVWITNPLPYARVIDRGRIEGEAGGEGALELAHRAAHFEGAFVENVMFQRHRGASGSLQAPHGMLEPTLEELLA